MTAYHGGKTRGGRAIAEDIADIVIDLEDTHGINFKGYWEPFCGMCGVFRHIPELLGVDRVYYASDIHKSVILMWQALQDGWKPPAHVTESMYNRLKLSSGSSAEKAYVGFGYSFGGTYFSNFIGKYGRSFKGLDTRVQSIVNKLDSVDFECARYDEGEALSGYVIYCDPPYDCRNNSFKLDGSVGIFDSHDFWKWANKMCRNNLVFVSELTAPRGWVVVHRKTMKANSLTSEHNEYVFVHRKWLYLTSNYLD